MTGRNGDLARRGSFIRTAKNEHGHAGLVGKSPRKLGEMRARPVLGGAKRTAGVETDDSLCRNAGQVQTRRSRRAASSSPVVASSVRTDSTGQPRRRASLR